VFSNVSHVFADGTYVLQNVSFQVNRGEFVAVIGPSGCGKSTLLRIAAGLLQPTSGDVICDRSRIGFVFQDPTLLPYRTVIRNVELFAEFLGIPKVERRRRASDVLTQVGLSGFEFKYPKVLSGGMKMRASLARSLMPRPTVFFLDEPFGALDEITRQRLNDDLLTLFASERFSAVFVTHSVSEACYLASRVIVMSSRPGCVLADVEVPFPYPRDRSLRFTPAFTERSRKIAALLYET
jgi:NitT/TauT family transport system ATP-binding protein